MIRESLLDPAWANGATLVERLTSLRLPESRPSAFELDTSLANSRLQRWREQAPFTNDGPFAQRMAVDKFTQEEFLRVLGEPIEAVHGRLPDAPDWLTELCSAYLVPTPDLGPNTKVAGILNLIEPLIRQNYARLHEGIKTLVETNSDLPFDPETISSVLCANLPGLLITLLARTLALEVNVARLEGLLEGNTPEERFNHFLTGLREPEKALAMLREYPVLARQFVVHLDSWLAFQLEFLRHLCADWVEICTTFSPGQKPGTLAELVGGVGDSHRGGRSVLVLKFSSGFQFVYKPKSLAVDVHLQELLGWLNEHGEHAPFQTVKVLNRGAYGWTEFVEAKSCDSIDGLRRFYERQGGYLALLYALEATDFHFENLIAAGEHPILIDLESLFHPRVEAIDMTPAGKVITSTVVHSVLRVGLLPQRILFTTEEEGVELSGLGGAAGQLTPRGVPFWEKPGTDEMSLARKRMEMPVAQNRPSLNGADVDPLEYSTDLAKGFSSIYRLLVQHRDELLAADGPLARFASDEVRFIVRPTRVYALLLNESFHPDVLRNGLDRDRLFDRLWVGIEQRPYLAKVIHAERRDLQNGDIPMFTTRPDSRDVWTSTNEQIVDFLDQRGLALVTNRIHQLSEEDLKRQLWFIHASLTTWSVAADGASWGTYPMVEPSVAADRTQLVAAAEAVGKRLGELVLRGEDGHVSWIGVSLLNEKHWTLLPLGLDLYNGLSGVAFFLAHLGEITGEKRYKELAHSALVTVRRQIDNIKSPSVGGFDGLGGWIYVLTHLSQLWSEPELLVEAESCVEQLPEKIENDKYLDVISGTAGCLGALMALYQCAPSARTLAVAVQCGDHLVDTAQPAGPGIGWLTPLTGSKPLAGFSHGSSGIASMLFALASLTGKERFRNAAQQALAYERSIFFSELGNWPDLREVKEQEPADSANQGSFMLAWCHGAPGVGLGRLRSLPHFDDGEIRGEIEVALRTTLTDGFGRNHSLCHGDLGNIELLLQASRTPGYSVWSSQVKRLSSIILESTKEYGWLCGIPLGVESPGLMTGLAGIGYGLLRLADPERIPSVLTLDAPIVGVPQHIRCDRQERREVALRDAQDIARSEMARRRRELGNLTPEQELSIETLLISTVNRVSKMVEAAKELTT